MTRLTAAGNPINLFQVNPTLTTGAANLEVNGGNTNYHGLQVELKRRMSKGLLFQGSYVWSHSISNEQSQGIARQLHHAARRRLRQSRPRPSTSARPSR